MIKTIPKRKKCKKAKWYTHTPTHPHTHTHTRTHTLDTLPSRSQAWQRVSGEFGDHEEAEVAQQVSGGRPASITVSLRTLQD